MPVTINGSAGVTTNSGAVYNSIQSDTAKTASGTSVDFTSIPSWVKRITVMFSGVSTNGSSNWLFQLGNSGGIENTGYVSVGTFLGSSVGGASFTTGFGLFVTASTHVEQGLITLSNLTGNVWTANGSFAGSGTAASFLYSTAGSKTLSDILTQIRITTVNGTDTFDAGSINILYE